MLLKFSVKNFLSFHDAVTLDMVSSSKIRANESHVLKLDGVSVLRNAAIYGANAAGKSNLIAALDFLQGCVRNNRLPYNAVRGVCKINSNYREEQTVFDIMFEKGGRYFDYGFSAELIRRKVTEEWLTELSRPGSGAGAPKTVFYWSEGEGFDKATLKSMHGKALSRMEVYTEDFLATTDALFLSSMNRGKDIQDDAVYSAFRFAYEFIARDLRIVGAGASHARFDIFSDETNLHEAGRMLGSFDTGVSGLKQNVMSFEEFGERNPSLYEFVQSIINESDDADFGGVLRSPGDFIEIDVSGEGDVAVREMLINHVGSDCEFEFDEESDGTQRLFDFLDLILSECEDTVFVIDEIDRSLHAMLTRRLLELFNERHGGEKVQLVFTTHETYLMRDDLLRRDEIWFMDRRVDGSSDLFPLDKFKERSDASIEKAYLKGRYGAIPVLRPFFAERDCEVADGSLA